MSTTESSSSDALPGEASAIITPSRVYNTYVDRLVALARARLNKRYQSKLDPGDVVHSVFRTYVRRVADGRLEARDWNSLWSLLARITVRKCIRKSTELQREKRDVKREVTLEDGDVQTLFASDPTPAEAALFEESFDHLMQALTPEQQKIVALKMQNYTNEEIAGIIGRAERTVYRVIRVVREKLAEEETQA